MATKSPGSTSSSKPPSYSHWADPRTKDLWQAARDKLTAGESLALPRMIPVVVSTPYESILLKQIAGLVECPVIATLKRLSTDEKETGEIVLICLLGEQVIFRLDGYIEDSEEYLVSHNGIPRYAYKFRGDAQVAITSEEAMKPAEPVRVLSLDGTNEYYQAKQQLQILNSLMSEMNGTLRPGDVFELIGGVGMSGLVSILLGHPYGTVSNCLSFLDRMTNPLDLDRLENVLAAAIYNFNKPQDDASSDGEDMFGKGYNQPMSDTEDDQSYLSESSNEQSLFEKQGFDLNKLLMSNAEGPKIFVKANVQNRQEEILLRTYYGDDPQMIFEDISILDAIRSTMAAFGTPVAAQFPSSQSHKDSVYEGPFGLQSLPQKPDTGWNNPIYDVYREARSIWPGRDIVIVSIGVGMVPLHCVIGSEEVVNRFKMNHPDMGKDNLFRFQPVGDTKLPKALFFQCAKRLLGYEPLSASETVSEEDFGGGLFTTDWERTALADETGKEKNLESRRRRDYRRDSLIEH